jgi:hypothetical protein
MPATKSKKEEPIISPFYNSKLMSTEPTKEITLNVAERLYATDLLTLWKGNVLLDGPALMEGAKAIVLSKEEVEAIEFKQEGQQRTWKAEKAVEKTMTLNGETVEYLLTKLKERDEAKETTFAEIPVVVSLREKLEK